MSRLCAQWTFGARTVPSGTSNFQSLKNFAADGSVRPRIDFTNKKVERFEDLMAWQISMDLAERAYIIADRIAAGRDFALSNQIAAICVPSSIAEGFERGTRSEFHRFLSSAKGSCAELRRQIFLGGRVRRLDRAAEQDFIAKAEVVARVIGKLRATVARQRRTPLIPHASCPMPDVQE